jgi:hypothetical protein
MSIARWLTAAVIFVGVAVGSAAPASADDPPPDPQVLEGVYTYTQPGAPLYNWTIYPTCVPVVGDLRVALYLPVGCVLHVTSDRENSGESFGGDARLVSDRWTFTVNNPSGVSCPDGSKKQSLDVYSFDAATMSGTKTISYSEECGLQPDLIKQPFTIAYQKPLPIPVDRYPLLCDPGGLRRCR